MANVLFKRGPEANLLTLTNYDDGCFYLTSDTHRLYTGVKVPNLKLINGNVDIFERAVVPKLKVITGNASLYSKINVPNLEIIGGDAYINITQGAFALNLKYIGGKARVF
jgi:hypothetical protein